MIDRRGFLRNTALGFGTAFLARSSSFAADSGSTIEVLLNEPLGTISPNIYGHFLEHFGTTIYDGVWVGEDSTIPNVGGIRKQLIDRLREIKSPVIRWPGGGFADSYDWKDGIGPRASRPRRTNSYLSNDAHAPAGPQRDDPNRFGTNEFMRFCQLTGSQPYLTANVRNLPAQDFCRWVEYCNSPAGTSLAEARKAGGATEPFGVRYWGIGNEQWGYLTAEEYAGEFRRFTSGVPRYGLDLQFIASGPVTDGWMPEGEWTRQMREWIHKLLEWHPFFSFPYGISLHYYAYNLSRRITNDLTGYREAMGDALKFEVVDWYEMLRQSDQVESMINTYWRTMGEQDPDHKVRIIVDEWGVWYRPGTGLGPLNVQGQAVTLRDALASALNLDTFNRHCDKVAMANCSFLINAFGSPFYAQGENFVTTPVYHVFQMYAAHQGGQSLRTIFDVPPLQYLRDGKRASFWGLNGSASLRDHELTLTVVNPHASEANPASVVIHGGNVKSGTVTTLAHKDIHATNTFVNPQEVHPTTADVKGSGSKLNHTFPPASASLLKLSLT
ncbi:MAG: alpha-L-arabinofuranosidase [Acidobacteria bacterium]|nr:alpha-L-arabinofuranosidase [Acidobacteriota bacterium]